MVRLVEKMRSTDGSYKFLFQTRTGNHYEALYFTFSEDGGLTERSVCCLSSQVGCRVGCAFCATGKLGFKENLDAPALMETAEQILAGLNPAEAPPEIFTFMGMGEPLLNIQALIDFYPLAMRCLPVKSLSLSTIVIPKLLISLADSQADYDLFVSLHSPWEERRRDLIPMAGQYSFRDFFHACDYFYCQKLSAVNRKIKLSYLLLAGVNDQPADIAKLKRILKDNLADGSYRVQLLMYNGIAAGGFSGTSLDRARGIRDEMIESGVDAYLSLSRGTDIGGGCGQFAGSRRIPTESCRKKTANEPEAKYGREQGEAADARIN